MKVLFISGFVSVIQPGASWVISCVVFSICGQCWSTMEVRLAARRCQENLKLLTCTALNSLDLPSVILAGCTQWKRCDTHIAWPWTQSKTYIAWKAEGCYTMQGNNTSHSSGGEQEPSSQWALHVLRLSTKAGFCLFFGCLCFCRKLLLCTTCVQNFRSSKTSLLVIQTLKGNISSI